MLRLVNQKAGKVPAPRTNMIGLVRARKLQARVVQAVLSVGCRSGVVVPHPTAPWAQRAPIPLN